MTQHAQPDHRVPWKNTVHLKNIPSSISHSQLQTFFNGKDPSSTVLFQTDERKDNRHQPYHANITFSNRPLYSEILKNRGIRIGPTWVQAEEAVITTSILIRSEAIQNLSDDLKNEHELEKYIRRFPGINQNLRVVSIHNTFRVCFADRLSAEYAKQVLAKDVAFSQPKCVNWPKDEDDNMTYLFLAFKISDLAKSAQGSRLYAVVQTFKHLLLSEINKAIPTVRTQFAQQFPHRCVGKKAPNPTIRVDLNCEKDSSKQSGHCHFDNLSLEDQEQFTRLTHQYFFDRFPSQAQASPMDQQSGTVNITINQHLIPVTIHVNGNRTKTTTPQAPQINFSPQNSHVFIPNRIIHPFPPPVFPVQTTLPPSLSVTTQSNQPPLQKSFKLNNIQPFIPHKNRVTNTEMGHSSFPSHLTSIPTSPPQEMYPPTKLSQLLANTSPPLMTHPPISFEPKPSSPSSVLDDAVANSTSELKAITSIPTIPATSPPFMNTQTVIPSLSTPFSESQDLQFPHTFSFGTLKHPSSVASDLPVQAPTETDFQPFNTKNFANASPYFAYSSPNFITAFPSMQDADLSHHSSATRTESQTLDLMVGVNSSLASVSMNTMSTDSNQLFLSSVSQESETSSDHTANTFASPIPFLFNGSSDDNNFKLTNSIPTSDLYQTSFSPFP
ncbi:hypothetical protein BLNAU_2202 [Blattamonas nauphoetae]|uniref:RRM domain-containing protein n=1 Tax=Blattamonas nauphoetae TaxID=2049346 RepID=A0ABQ9YG91_9EUKA|nr:hypothetical protein BLNAU_2202 [Blattamonas nauphoetae]